MQTSLREWHEIIEKIAIQVKRPGMFVKVYTEEAKLDGIVVYFDWQGGTPDGIPHFWTTSVTFGKRELMNAGSMGTVLNMIGQRLRNAERDLWMKIQQATNELSPFRLAIMETQKELEKEKECGGKAMLWNAGGWK